MRCRYCDKEFTERGLPRHLRHCKALVAAKKARGVLVLNEDVTLHVFSFLGLHDLLVVYPLLGLSADLLCDEFASARGWRRVNSMLWRDFIEKYVLGRVCKTCGDPLFAVVPAGATAPLACRTCTKNPTRVPRSRARKEYKLGWKTIYDLPYEPEMDRGGQIARNMYAHKDLVGAMTAKHGDAYELAFANGRRAEREERQHRAFMARCDEIESLLGDLSEPIRREIALHAAGHNIECVRASIPNLIMYGRMSRALRLEFDLHFIMHVPLSVFYMLIMGIELRQRVLRRELARRGLPLASNSELCWTYIYDETLIDAADPSRDAIENIVDREEEIHYVTEIMEGRERYVLRYIRDEPDELDDICLVKLRQALRANRSGMAELSLPRLWRKRLAILRELRAAGREFCHCAVMRYAVLECNRAAAFAHESPCGSADIARVSFLERQAERERMRELERELELARERDYAMLMARVDEVLRRVSAE